MAGALTGGALVATIVIPAAAFALIVAALGYSGYARRKAAASTGGAGGDDAPPPPPPSTRPAMPDVTKGLTVALPDADDATSPGAPNAFTSVRGFGAPVAVAVSVDPQVDTSLRNVEATA